MTGPEFLYESCSTAGVLYLEGRSLLRRTEERGKFGVVEALGSSKIGMRIIPILVSLESGIFLSFFLSCLPNW